MSGRSEPASARRARHHLRAIALITPLMLLTCAAGRASAFTIVATYDTSITQHPQGATIMATIGAAITQYEARILDPTTVNITFRRMYSGLGGSSTPYYTYSYPTYLSALRGDAASLDDAVALSHLPPGPGNGINGDSVRVTTALSRKFNLAAPQPEPRFSISVLLPNPDISRSHAFDRASVVRALQALPNAVNAGSDGTISLNLDLCNLTTGATPLGKYGLLGVVSHEIDEVLGSASILTGVANGDPVPQNDIYPQDLFRYAGNGARSFTTSIADSDSASFSLDGIHMLVRCNQRSDGDASDWWSNGNLGALIPRVQDAFMTPGVDPPMGVEWTLLDVLGWRMAPLATWVDFNGTNPLQNGLYPFPYHTLAGGIGGTSSGGLVLIKNGGVVPDGLTLTTPMTFTAVNGQ